MEWITSKLLGSSVRNWQNSWAVNDVTNLTPRRLFSHYVLGRIVGSLRLALLGDSIVPMVSYS